ncbi:MAG: hypothetical protein KAI84_20655, partial [Gammaproteobacteria bacterium]|nr:hypothetical protein [Gammaproteobacteria bacterium]
MENREAEYSLKASVLNSGECDLESMVWSMPKVGVVMWFRFTSLKGCASQTPSQTLLPIRRN